MVKICLTVKGEYFCLQPPAFDVEFWLRTWWRAFFAKDSKLLVCPFSTHTSKSRWLAMALKSTNVFESGTICLCGNSHEIQSVLPIYSKWMHFVNFLNFFLLFILKVWIQFFAAN